MERLKTFTAAALLSAALPAAAALAPASAAAASDPSGLAWSRPTTTTTTTASSATVARHPGADTLAAPGRVVGELDSPGEVPPPLARLVDGRGVEGGTGPHGGPGGLSGGPWCNVQCITDGIAYQHGTGARLIVHTSVPAQMLVTVFLDDNHDYVPDDGVSLHETTDGYSVTELVWDIEDLQPGVSYYGAVAASDQYGNTSVAWGTFELPA